MYSKAFKVGTINATFNAVIERDSATGRIPAALLLAVEKDYGVVLSPKVREFVATLNVEFQSAQKVRVPLVQVLHQCASAVIASGMVKSPPSLLPLPEWADPAILEEKRLAAKSARAAKKEAAGADDADAEADGADADGAVQPVPDVSAALALVHAAISNGALTADQVSALQAALATAQRAPVPEKSVLPKVRKARKARESKAAQVAVDAMTA